MQTEVEAKFLNTDHDKIREKLKNSGATCFHKNRLMRRKNYDYPDGRLEKIGGWIRVRDESNKVTLAYKQLNDRTLHGTKEVSVTVSNFDKTCQLLENIGLKIISYQETKRESWKLGNTEIELDEWPWIKTFIEVEAPDEKRLKDAISKLGLNLENAVHGSVENAYQAEFDITEAEVDAMPEIRFCETPKWLQQRRKQ